MIYLDLFFGFLLVGCFSFGGAYGAIPLIRDVVLSYGWIEEEMLSYMIAVSESTPGPIMINLATYVGSDKGGVLGALVATLAVILPSFFVILALCALLKTAVKNKYVQAILRGLKPCVVGIVLATGAYMIYTNCFGRVTGASFDFGALVVTSLLVVVALLYKLLAKRKLSPIMLIIVSAVLGVIAF